MTFPNTPTGFCPNPVYHYLVKQAVNPCYWLSQKLTCLDAQTSKAMWFTYIIFANEI